MEVANWITAISTLVMALATIIMAVAAWQAKDNFIKETRINLLLDYKARFNDYYNFLLNKIIYASPTLRNNNLSENNQKNLSLIRFFNEKLRLFLTPKDNNRLFQSIIILQNFSDIQENDSMTFYLEKLSLLDNINEEIDKILKEVK